MKRLHFDGGWIGSTHRRLGVLWWQEDGTSFRMAEELGKVYRDVW